MGWLRVCFDLAALVCWLGMFARIGARPAGRFRHGRVGKALALVAVGLLVGSSAGWWFPWGALIVWWRNPGRLDDFELPMADGRRMK